MRQGRGGERREGHGREGERKEGKGREKKKHRKECAGEVGGDGGKISELFTIIGTGTEGI